MKINPSNDTALPITSVGSAKLDRGTASRQAAVASAADSTTAAGSPDNTGVPFRTSAAFRALGAVSGDSGVDAAKVAAVRAAIDNGTFRVNAESIADKLLSNAQELLRRN